MVLETAALDVAADIAGTKVLQGISCHVMFVARGKVGPFRIDGEPLSGADGLVAVRVVMHDEGADDRITTVGSYLFRAERA